MRHRRHDTLPCAMLRHVPTRALLAVLAGGLVAAASAVAEEAAATVAGEASARDAAWLDALGRSADALVWSDEAIRHDWRMQRRPRSAAWRILDPQERVVQQGSRDECERGFAALEHSGQAPAVRGPTVIVLHGLGEGRRSMRPLVEHLRGRLDATVLAFGYASTAEDIEAHGRSLAAVIASLPQAEQISFVGHSLGNLVVRRWMGLAPREDLARVRRVVMLGPPNQGSELARMVAGVDFLAGLAEGAARDLVLDWKRVSGELAVPPCDFGIVAGGKGDDRGFSGLLAGDDDAVVRVEETRLDGADDFLLVPVHHAAMMRHPAVQRATATFLETGRFGSPGAP